MTDYRCPCCAVNLTQCKCSGQEADMLLSVSCGACGSRPGVACSDTNDAGHYVEDTSEETRSEREKVLRPRPEIWQKSERFELNSSFHKCRYNVFQSVRQLCAWSAGPPTQQDVSNETGEKKNG